MTNQKGQSAFEYFVMIAGALLFGVFIVSILSLITPKKTETVFWDCNKYEKTGDWKYIDQIDSDHWPMVFEIEQKGFECLHSEERLIPPNWKCGYFNDSNKPCNTYQACMVWREPIMKCTEWTQKKKLVES